MARRKDSRPVKFYSSKKSMLDEQDKQFRAKYALEITLPEIGTEELPRKIYVWADSHQTAKGYFFDRILKADCKSVLEKEEQLLTLFDKPRKAAKKR